jgi:hypothetical protein
MFPLTGGVQRWFFLVPRQRWFILTTPLRFAARRPVPLPGGSRSLLGGGKGYVGAPGEGVLSPNAAFATKKDRGVEEHPQSL